METVRERIARALEAARRILIVAHERPDADALGGALALALALERLGKEVVVGSQEGVPQLYRFLPTWERVTATPPQDRFDVSVGMECSDLARAGNFAAPLRAARMVINLDHHLDNSGYGDLVWVEPEASAVVELVAELIRELRVPFEEPIATCLMAGLLTDTGSFRYASVRPESFLLAAELVRCGARPHEIYERVYESRSPASMRLLGWSLVRMRLELGGALAWTVVDEALLREAGASWEDTENIVSHLRGIAGVRVAVLFRVDAEEVRVSLRSRGGVRVNELAARFGGGGHAQAAGFTSTEPSEQVIQKTLHAAGELLRAAPAAGMHGSFSGCRPWTDS
ncbi:MAG: bifunctional oligoribonuclease/PAP phosphatase NrnA [Armatimonadota bacterium]|nr:bifunctional oligoribonuclease/PAP phosphatase NrnA [Armatimonadota bacterium]MDR7438412.1 bifunctional oligoribonuclease/PAP phosphatase NrnA [Armatimonadota bacterium]MDR7562211.1 bifunctional oligoribonuclease/PAP phosphatase NrnA [Armatimonadota bacterium]MDR7567191.1 bifunctional oligoribonuclease/PAP phosphatase NrnA [Armatimonadota bacterium]MDR7601256.1 bifunctional oligoribonuclease/PAP phosphatase NrnA [Armatimonadota bacterium]